MPQIINTNIASLNAQRNLNKSQAANQTSLQRLSSGLRINSAKDDAAGLAISTRFNSQIRGLNVAVRNAGDGISLAQTAEGALGSMNDNLQRVRELAVQSANATNSDVDRDALQAEVEQLLSEVSRTADETDFNGRKLLDGSFNATFQIGANAGQTLDISIAELTSDKLGASDAVGISSQGSANALGNGDLIINGTDIKPSKAEDDAFSFKDADTSAIAKVEAINREYDTTGVKAVANENTLAGNEMVAGATNTNGTVQINGVDIAITATTDAAGTRAGIVAAINASSDQTGVMAIDTDSDSGGVSLVAEDGRNITISLGTDWGATTAAQIDTIATTTGLSFDTDTSGGLSATRALEANGGNTYQGGFTLVADGDVPEVIVTGGDGTGNGDLANAGLSAGTYSTTQAQLATDTVTETDGVNLSSSFSTATSGIAALGVQLAAGTAGAGSAATAFGMSTTAGSEVITISAGGQSVQVGGTSSVAGMLGTSGNATGFGADALAAGLSAIDGIEASAETKMVLSGFNSGAAASSGKFDIYAAGTTSGELVQTITFNSTTTLEDIGASINAGSAGLVATYHTAGGATLTITDDKGRTLKTMDTGGTYTVNVQTVAASGTLSGVQATTTTGVVSVGYINETNITSDSISEISIASNRQAGTGTVAWATDTQSAVFSTTGFRTGAATLAGAYDNNAVTATTTASLVGLTDGDLKLNGVSVPAAEALSDTASATVATDGSSIQTSTKLGSAIATAAAVNDVADETGVTAIVNETRVVGSDTTTDATVAANSVAATGALYAAGDSGKLYINGVDLGIVSLADDGTGSIDLSASRTSTISAINAKSGQTGVTAEDNGKSITLVAADGRNISVAIDNDEANNAGKGVGFGALIGLDANVDGIGEADIGISTAANTTGTRGSASEGATYETTYGTLTLQSAKQIDVDVSSGGKDELAAMGLTAGKFGGGESGQFLTEIDISTFEGATAALTAIDNAIGSIASQRADLGAIQNRMESTVSNLAITSENLSAANSRIQDADFAAETAELSRTQVLQQAGISILAQANQGPQQVLSLLG
jgi:flagellin